MVRFVGRNLTMDNREELLDALNEFSRKQSKEIPVLLEQFLKRVAKTGETLFPWTLLKNLFVAKLEQVMTEFGSDFNAELIPPCPNVENARFEVYRTRIMEAVNRFHGAPFTIQRLCELLTDPRQHYKRCDKFLRGLEKNILVVSTVDPFGRKVVSESKTLVNGMEGGADDNSNSNASSGTLPPPVPAWNTSSTATVWPHNADAISTSTAPLLEVSDLPEPGQAAGAAPSLADAPPSLDGLDVTSTTASGELPTDSTPAVAASTAAEPEAVSSSSSTEVAASSSVVTAVTSESAVDSCEQQVAAEEMVGMEVTAANAEPPPEPEPVAAEGGDMLADGAGVVDQVMKDVAEVVEASDMVAPSAGGDWLSKIGGDKGCEAAPAEQPACDNVSTDKGLESTTIITPDTSMDLDSSNDLHKLADMGTAVTSNSDTEPGGLPHDVSHIATAAIEQHSSAEAIEPESSSVTLGSSGPACQQGATVSEALPPTFPLAETSLAASESSKDDSSAVGSTDQIGDPAESLASGNSAATMQCDETDGGEPTSLQSTDFVAVVAQPPAENRASVLDSAESQLLPPADDTSKTAGSGSADEVSNATGSGSAGEVSNTAESDCGSHVLGRVPGAVAEVSSSVSDTESSAAPQQQNSNASQEQQHQDNMTSQEQQQQAILATQEQQQQVVMATQEQQQQVVMATREQQQAIIAKQEQQQAVMETQEQQHAIMASQEPQQESYVPDSTPQHEAMEQD